MPLGDCAAVRVGGVEVVLITKRTQALGLELFTNLGIDPRARKLVVVKSTNHFMAAFGPIAKKVIYVESGGPLNRDYRQIPYTRVNRPIWPLDEIDGAGPDLAEAYVHEIALRRGALRRHVRLRQYLADRHTCASVRIDAHVARRTP